MAELVLERLSVRLLGRICLVYRGCLGGVCKVCSFEYPHPTCCVQNWQYNIGAMDIPRNLFTCINLSTLTTIRRSCITMLYTLNSQCESKNSDEVNACLHVMSESRPTPTDISGEDHFSSMLQVWDGNTIELRHLFSKEITSLCNTLTFLYYHHHSNTRWTTAFSVKSDCNKLGQAESNLVIAAWACPDTNI